MTLRFITAGMVVGLVVNGCGDAAPEVSAEVNTPSLAGSAVRTALLGSGANFVTARLPAVATAMSAGSVAVASPCEGRVVTVHVNEGDVVTSGAPLADITCLDAGVLTARESAQSQRIRTLDKRARELRALRTDGLVDIQRVVDVERELLTARSEHAETKALLARAGLDSAEAREGATITLAAMQDGVVAHVGANAGNLIDRVGTPIVTLNSLTTTRIEADVFTEPRADERFRFRGPAGATQALSVISVRPVTRDPDDLTSTRLRVSLSLADAASEAIRIGTRGHVEVTRDDPGCRRLPAHAVQRRPQPDGTSSFCVFDAATPDACLSVSVAPGDGDAVLVCGESLPAVGTTMRSHVPSWTVDVETGGDAPTAAEEQK